MKKDLDRSLDLSKTIRRSVEGEELRHQEEASQILMYEKRHRTEELAAFVAAACAGQNAYLETTEVPGLPDPVTLVSLGVWNKLLNHKEEIPDDLLERPCPRKQKSFLAKEEKEATDDLFR